MGFWRNQSRRENRLENRNSHQSEEFRLHSLITIYEMSSSLGREFREYRTLFHVGVLDVAILPHIYFSLSSELIAASKVVLLTVFTAEFLMLVMSEVPTLTLTALANA